MPRYIFNHDGERCGKKGDYNASGLPQQYPDSVGRMSPQMLLTLIRGTKMIDK